MPIILCILSIYHTSMDQKIDQETTREFAKELVCYGAKKNAQVNGIVRRYTTEKDFIEMFQNRPLNEVKEFINGISDNGFRNSLKLILTNAQLRYANETILTQQIEINNQSKQLTEMNADIKTLNEKMAVLIDALSTLDSKSSNII